MLQQDYFCDANLLKIVVAKVADHGILNGTSISGLRAVQLLYISPRKHAIANSNITVRVVRSLSLYSLLLKTEDLHGFRFVLNHITACS